MFWRYIANPSVSLSVVGSGGNLGILQYDWRLTAGNALARTERYPTEAETSEPLYITTEYRTLNQNIASLTVPSDTNLVGFPLFYTNTGNLQAMSLQDMYDTFAFSVIDSLIASSAVYTLSTSTPSGYTSVSGTPIHIDTKANLAAYNASEIPETTDQPVEVSRSYLYKRNDSSTSYTVPVKATSSSNPDIQIYSEANFNSLLSAIIRFVATNVSGYRIRYGINLVNFNVNNNVDGNSCGGVTDTELQGGSGNYQTRFVNADDYRAQEFPNGTLSSYTSYLKVRKE
jgi:hypothetical protein